MKNLLKYILLISIAQSLPSKLYAQTSEAECSKYVHKSIDSFFLKKLGQKEYLAKRDSISMWLVFNIDTTGKVFSCQINKTKNINESEKSDLCEFLKEYKFICLYNLYIFPKDVENTRVNFYFRPKQYTYCGDSGQN